MDRNEVIKQHIGMIRSIINKYVPDNIKDLYEEDMIIEGMLAVDKSITTFDESKNVSFSTYAYRNILGNIQHYMRDKTTIYKISRKNRALYTEIIKLKNKNNDITIDDISKELDIPIKTVSDIINAFNPASFEYKIAEQNNGSCERNLGLLMTDNLNVEQEVIDNEVIKDLIDKLENPRQKQIAKMIVRGYEQKDVAKSLGVSPSTICRDIKKMKKVLSN